MRLRILHETEYSYRLPANRAIQTLRVTPRGHGGQFIIDWRLEISRDCRPESTTDAFGNIVHSFNVDGPLERLTITSTGEVETEDRAGVLSGQIERFPASLFLRDTPLTKPVDGIRDLANAALSAGTSTIPRLHTLMDRVSESMRQVAAEIDSGVSAGEALALGKGDAQDFAHIFIAAARHIGIPARYVSGYLLRDGVAAEAKGCHGWAEAYVEGTGWIGFDPANRLCPTDAYVRLAIGLDHLGAAPFRGTRFGGSGEEMKVRILVKSAGGRPG